jgi:uncharacterized surface protein with fasciclin (FAS1) repeats
MKGKTLALIVLLVGAAVLMAGCTTPVPDGATPTPTTSPAATPVETAAPDGTATEAVTPVETATEATTEAVTPVETATETETETETPTETETETPTETMTEDVNETNTTELVDMNIVETLDDMGDFTTLLTAAEAADLAGTLADDQPFTLFAPTDAAFDALPEGTLDDLLADPEGLLTPVLEYHVANAELYAEDVVVLPSIATLEGTPLEVTVDGSVVSVDGATITEADIIASNGVIHVIDAVLIPPGLTIPEENTTAENTTS